MATVTIYQKPTCTTCRQVYNALLDSGVDMASVDYFTSPLSAPKLRELIKKMGITPRELLRTKDPAYAELHLAERNLPDEELIGLMIRHPGLMQRPIVEKGNRAILARPAERLRELF
jgi:arsenate reductase